MILCAGTAAADTVLVADFRAEGRENNGVAISLGLPYMIARSLNGTPGIQAILPDPPAGRPIARLYNTDGMPDFEAAGRLLSGTGAQRCLLGRAARPPRAGGASTVVFYLLDSGGGRPEAFSAEISGDACLPALAAWAAARIAPRGARVPAPAIPHGLLPSFSRGLGLLRAGDADGAELALLGAAREYPASADLRFLLGSAAARRGKPYDALRLFNEASNLDPSFSLPPYREGMVWLSLGRETLAEKAFDRAVGAQPSFFEALLESGAIKTASGSFQAAETALRRAIAMRPGHFEARYRLAKCLALEGKAGRAIGILRALAAEHGGHGPSRLLLGKLLFQASEYRAAEAEARVAVRLMPDDPEAHALLADALSRQGGLNRSMEAESELRKAIRLQDAGR